MIDIPPLPPAADGEGSATSTLSARYEDVTQDGRVLLTSMMSGLGGVWRAMMTQKPETEGAMRASGVLPILRRLILVGDQGPFSVHVPVSYEGHWRFAREKGGDRLFLNMWLEARAPNASTFAPPPPPDAERVRVGAIFAEHVITRPFAPKEERKVTRLDLLGLPPVPEHEHVFEDTEALVSNRPLADETTVVFGMMHTDSNQHVNSLVYPRMFEEAVTRISRSVQSKDLLARAMELRFRKPFFAGDRALLRVSVSGNDACATISADESARPSTTMALRLA